MAEQTQSTAAHASRVESRFPGRLSTGAKMFIILSLALLPLGLIAVFTSQESAQANRLQNEAEARAAAMSSAGAISAALGPATLAFREALNDLNGSITEYPINREQCALRLQALLDRYSALGGAAVLRSNGPIVCAKPNYRRVPAYFPAMADGAYEVRLAPAQQLIWTSVNANGGYFGVAQFPKTAIARLLPAPAEGRGGVILQQGSQFITLRSEPPRKPLNQTVRVLVPLEGGQVGLEMRMPGSSLSAVDVLLILLPILMWAASGMIGWLVVDRLLLRPLGQMQRAIAVFTSGEGPLALPRLKTPAREIRELGESFQRATEALTAHEKELADGLANQKRLTREVHHRVKNNLQVVSSLINLHSRGSTSEDVSEAYASIQRRVDALAVVHRNHYAELEDNQGVSMRALIGEITSNLKATARPRASQMGVTLNLMSASATQDIAVPIAFLVTEIVELVMLCAPATNITISLTPVPDKPDRAMLVIAAPALASEPCITGSEPDRFRRIAGGLARQLRSPLEHEVAAGRYAIEISVMPAAT